jgi:hypothetical protein
MKRNIFCGHDGVRMRKLLLLILFPISFHSCQRADIPAPSLGPAGSLIGLRWEIPAISPASDNVDNVVDPPVVTAIMGGTSGTSYQVTLRFRGVVEQKTYFGGTNTGYWNVGGTPDGGAFNIYQLNTSDPMATYYLNSGTSGIYNCFALDYQETITIKGGATVSLIAQTVDGHQIKNIDPSGTPIVIPGISPAPAAFNGQFIQMDVMAVN